MYNNEVLEVFMNSPYNGSLKGATVSSALKSKDHGDAVKLYIKINELQIIEDIKYKSFGGVPISYATSKLCELVLGKTLIQAQKVNEKKLLEFLGLLPQESHYVAELCTKALADCIKKYFAKVNIKED